MKEAANSLLKVLEEPPEYAHILLLTENVSDLLPTIRSRSSIFRLGTLPWEEIDALLAKERKDWNPKQRQLVARLAEGGVGRALGFDLEGYLASRQDALTILSTTDANPDYGALFRVTETYRGGADGQQKTSALLHAFAGLVEDLLLLRSGAGSLIRNIDLIKELTRMSEGIDVAWLEAAVRGFDQVEQGMRRNLLRSLSLDAFAAGLRSQ